MVPFPRLSLLQLLHEGALRLRAAACGSIYGVPASPASPPACSILHIFDVKKAGIAIVVVTSQRTYWKIVWSHGWTGSSGPQLLLKTVVTTLEWKIGQYHSEVVIGGELDMLPG